jgi:hypothetical protein
MADARTLLSPKLIRQQYGDVAFHEHWCPGCKTTHQIAVEQPFRNGARWTWDGNVDLPTFNPSIHCEPNMPERRCHYFLHQGKLKFLPDCHHELAGEVVDLPDIPERWRT